MLWLRKSKKGFTLIELMVVVAIIGVLALMGLRVYSGQQEKAKNAVIKANVGTIQTLIQAELADKAVSVVWADIKDTGATTGLFGRSGIHNPVTGSAQSTPVTGTGSAVSIPVDTADGDVVVYYYEADKIFYINGNDASSAEAKVYPTDLQARK